MSEEPPVADVNSGDDPSATGEAEPKPQKWPIGFVLLIVAGALYLILRAIQMIGWLIDWAG
jgi:hypothetical protein